MGFLDVVPSTGPAAQPAANGEGKIVDKLMDGDSSGETDLEVLISLVPADRRAAARSKLVELLKHAYL